MSRITPEQQAEISKYQLTQFQYAVYKNLLQSQINYPQLTKRQYRLFLQILEQAKKNKSVIKYHHG